MTEKILSEFLSATTKSGLFDSISHYTTTLAESPSYIFDADHVSVFARLEDVQFKLTNLASAVASSTAAAALASLSVSSFSFAQTITNCSQLSATDAEAEAAAAEATTAEEVPYSRMAYCLSLH